MVETYQSNIQQLSQNTPTITDILGLLKTNIFANLNCHNIGKILEFNPQTCTCTVELMQIKQFNKKLYTPVPITNVPLIICGSGGGHITMPNPVGTICILLFMDRNIDTFLETGESYVPPTTRMHDFTDCIALTTFKTLANPLTEYDEKAVTIMNEEIIEGIKNKSYIKVYGDNVQIKTIQGEATSAAINVSNKINIQNNLQNLAGLIQSFLVACESIVVDPNSGALTPASKQLFTDLKTQFEELLE